MNGKHWVELDYRVASDYTYGSPEHYRTILRKAIGLPDLLPGEKHENSKHARDRKGRNNQISRRGDLPGFFHQG